jgi:hypothetical protein
MARSEQMMPAKVVAKGPVLSVYFEGIAAGWEQWVLLTSDNHHDSVYCDWVLEKYHLDQAREREAVILNFGDLFCAMQGKYDPRSSMDDIRPEDVGENYLDLIVQHAAEFYGPYAENFLLLGHGNHETNIRRRYGTDLTSNLCHRLNTDCGAKCHVGGYGGWVRFMFAINKTKRQSVRLKYFHGSGGGGPVTRGVIQTNRMAVFLPDADIVAGGHTHDSWILPRARERLSMAGRQYKDLVWFVRIPGYKDEYGDGAAGFHIEKGRDPRPVGAVWVRFYYDAIKQKRVLFECTQAVV